MKEHRSIGEWRTIGTYQGLKVEAYNAGNHMVMALSNPETNIRHESSQLTQDTINPAWTIRRLDNVLDDMIGAHQEVEDKLEDTKRQLAYYNETLDREFEKAEELDDLEAQAEILQEHLGEYPEASHEMIDELLGDVHELSDESREIKPIPGYDVAKIRGEVLEVQERLREEAARRREAETAIEEGETQRIEIDPSTIDLGTIEIATPEPGTPGAAGTVAPGDLQASKSNPYPYCLDGCGLQNKPKSRFAASGHDAKAKSILLNVSRGKLGVDAIPEVMIQAARDNPGFYIASYTANDILGMAGEELHESVPDRTPGQKKPSTPDGQPGGDSSITGDVVEDAASEAASEAAEAGADSAKVEVKDVTTGDSVTVVVDKEEDGEFRIQPTDKHPWPYCLDGCGAKTNVGKRFIAGHDPKLKSILDKVADGRLPPSAIPQEMVDAVERNPDTFAGKYTSADILALINKGKAEPTRIPTVDSPPASDAPEPTTTAVEPEVAPAPEPTAVEPETVIADIPPPPTPLPVPPKPRRPLRPTTPVVEGEQTKEDLARVIEEEEARQEFEAETEEFEGGPPEEFVKEITPRRREAPPPRDRELDDVDEFIRKYAPEDADPGARDEDDPEIEDGPDIEKYVPQRTTAPPEDDSPVDLDIEYDDSDEDDEDDDYTYTPGIRSAPVRPTPRPIPTTVAPPVQVDPVVESEPEPAAPKYESAVGRSIGFRVVEPPPDEDDPTDVPNWEGPTPVEDEQIVDRVSARIADDLRSDSGDGVAVVTGDTTDAVILEETQEESLLEGAPAQAESRPAISLENIPPAPTPTVKVDDVIVDTGTDKPPGPARTGQQPWIKDRISEQRYQARGGRGGQQFRR